MHLQGRPTLPDGTRRRARRTPTASAHFVVRPAHPRVPAGDAPRGLRRPRRRAADRRRDARRDRRGRPAVHRPGPRARSTWSSSSSTCGSTTGVDKWDVRPLDLRDLKASLGRWQAGLADVGWNSLYWDNHDQPRVVSRFGDDGEHRVESAKMLATVLHLHRGTPYVYQGEELGMANVPFACDRGLPRHRVAQPLRARRRRRAAPTRATCWPALRPMSRDNARTPVQWDAGPHAGFTTGTPWLRGQPRPRRRSTSPRSATTPTRCSRTTGG